jgi:hypothetical protein
MVVIQQAALEDPAVQVEQVEQEVLEDLADGEEMVALEVPVDGEQKVAMEAQAYGEDKVELEDPEGLAEREVLVVLEAPGPLALVLGLPAAPVPAPPSQRTMVQKATRHPLFLSPTLPLQLLSLCLQSCCFDWNTTGSKTVDFTASVAALLCIYHS